MSLDAKLTLLSQNIGYLFKSTNVSLTGLQTQLDAVKLTADGAIPKNDTSGATTTVNTPLNFTVFPQISGSPIASTTSVQTLTNKTLTTPTFNGYKVTSGLFSAGGDILITAPTVLIQSSAALSLRLPVTSGNSGVRITIKNVTATATTHTITARSGNTIDGATSVTLTGAYSCITLFCTTSNWFIESRFN